MAWRQPLPRKFVEITLNGPTVVSTVSLHPAAYGGEPSSRGGIQVRDLHRTYKVRRAEPVQALRGLSFEVPPSTTTVLLGPNGAGKTTTFRIVSTLLRPTTGSVFVDGIDVAMSPAATRRLIGLSLGGDSGLYERLTGLENLEYFGALQGISRRAARQRGRDLLDRFGLGETRQNVGGYSRGMKQRLHIARALLHEPRVLLLDEPTSGLDPDSARLIRMVIRSLKAQGNTILLSTHLLTEAEQLADRITVIGRGRALYDGPPSDLRLHVPGDWVLEVTSRRDITERVDGRSDFARLLTEEYDGVHHVIAFGRGERADLESLRSRLSNAGLISVQLREPSLEDAYVLLMRDADGAESL